MGRTFAEGIHVSSYANKLNPPTPPAPSGATQKSQLKESGDASHTEGEENETPAQLPDTLVRIPVDLDGAHAGARAYPAERQGSADVSASVSASDVGQA